MFYAWRVFMVSNCFGGCCAAAGTPLFAENTPMETQFCLITYNKALIMGYHMLLLFSFKFVIYGLIFWNWVNFVMFWLVLVSMKEELNKRGSVFALVVVFGSSGRLDNVLRGSC